MLSIFTICKTFPTIYLFPQGKFYAAVIGSFSVKRDLMEITVLAI